MIRRMIALALLAAAAVLATAAGNSDIWRRKPAGLVAGFDFSGGRTTSPTGHSGSLSGNASASACHLAVDGSGDYMTVGDAPELSFSSSGQDKAFTVMAWVWMDSALTTRKFIIFKSAEYALELSPSTEPYKGISMTCWNSSYTAGIIGHMNTVTGLSSGTWLHVCASYSGSENSTGFSLYLNGAAQARTAVPPYGGYAGMSDTSASVQFCGAGSSYQWAGKIDGSMIFSRELSASEIAQIYNAGAARIANGGTP